MFSKSGCRQHAPHFPLPYTLRVYVLRTDGVRFLCKIWSLLDAYLHVATLHFGARHVHAYRGQLPFKIWFSPGTSSRTMVLNRGNPTAERMEGESRYLSQPYSLDSFRLLGALTGPGAVKKKNGSG